MGAKIARFHLRAIPPASTGHPASQRNNDTGVAKQGLVLSFPVSKASVFSTSPQKMSNAPAELLKQNRTQQAQGSKEAVNTTYVHLQV